MKNTDSRLLSGCYLEIYLSHDIILNHHNIDEIKRRIIFIIEQISFHILDYIERGFFVLKRTFDGLMIIDALSEVIKYLSKKMSINQQVLKVLNHTISDVLIKFDNKDDVKMIYKFIYKTIKSMLIEYKIPTDIPVILNIVDIDLYNFKRIPDNVIAVVLDETVDYTVQRHLSHQKIIYINTIQSLNPGDWYDVDTIHRKIYQRNGTRGKLNEEPLKTIG